MMKNFLEEHGSVSYNNGRLDCEREYNWMHMVEYISMRNVDPNILHNQLNELYIHNIAVIDEVSH